MDGWPVVPDSTVTETTTDFDAIVIGAGVSGLYQLYRLRELGLRVRVLVLYPNVTDNSGTAECGKIVSFSCREKGTVLWHPIRCFTNAC